MNFFCRLQIGAFKLNKLRFSFGEETGEVAMPALQDHVLVENYFLVQSPRLDVGHKLGEGIGIEPLPDLTKGVLLVLCLLSEAFHRFRCDGSGSDGNGRTLALLVRHGLTSKQQRPLDDSLPGPLKPGSGPPVAKLTHDGQRKVTILGLWCALASGSRPSAAEVQVMVVSAPVQSASTGFCLIAYGNERSGVSLLLLQFYHVFLGM